MADVLVFCEVRDGKLRKPSREALSAGRKLASQASGSLVAFAAGSTARAAADEIGKFGVKRLLVAGNASLDVYLTETFTDALKLGLDQGKPSILLFAGTSNGKDLAPRIAARLNVGVASDVDSLEWSGGKLKTRRSVYSGKAFAHVEVDGQPAIAITRSNAFPVEEGDATKPEVVEIPYNAPAQTRVRVLETKTPESGELSIAEADIIVSGGRGLKEAGNFSYIRDLAHAIGGAVGASRATVDAGWIDHQHQVGQTGRVVSPNLYIAAGISGAIQHLAGMSSSKHIVAINKDPEAAIFRVADLGVVGDLFTILPALTEEVKKARAH
jgi:electron transfer flavoprotein alpha subunit